MNVKDVREIDSRSLRTYSVNVLFRNILNQDQISNISQLIRTISRYMVMDRNMINSRIGKPIGLSYIKKAVNYGLVTELKYRDDIEEKDIFYFQLNVAGIYFAENAGYILNVLPLDTSGEDKQRILTFNKWSIEKGYDLDIEFSIRKKFDIFMCKTKTGKNVAAYYSNKANIEKIVGFLYRALNTKDKIIMTTEAIETKYEFEVIDTPLMEFGNKTAGSEESEIV